MKGNNQIPPTPINGEELIENYPAELLQGYISDSIKPVNSLAKSQSLGHLPNGKNNTDQIKNYNSDENDYAFMKAKISKERTEW